MNKKEKLINDKDKLITDDIFIFKKVTTERSYFTPKLNNNDYRKQKFYGKIREEKEKEKTDAKLKGLQIVKNNSLYSSGSSVNSLEKNHHQKQKHAKESEKKNTLHINSTKSYMNSPPKSKFSHTSTNSNNNDNLQPLFQNLNGIFVQYAYNMKPEPSKLTSGVAPVKKAHLQVREISKKPLYDARSATANSTNHKDVKAKVNDHMKLEKKKKKITSDVQVKSIVKPVKPIEREVIVPKTLKIFNEVKSQTPPQPIEVEKKQEKVLPPLSISSSQSSSTKDLAEERKDISLFINKLENIKVNDEMKCKTKIHHEMQRDRNFLDDFIYLDQIESFEKESEIVNEHVWSVDVFVENRVGKMSKQQAYNMIWNIYAILILNNENGKPVLSFQTIELIKGRLQRLVNTKENINTQLYKLIPSILKAFPDEEIAKIRGLLGHISRIINTFSNNVSNSIAMVFSPLILPKINDIILYPDSIVYDVYKDKPMTRLQSANQEIEDEEELKKINERGKIIKKEEIQGIGKKEFFEKAFFEQGPLNIGDLIFKLMITYYKQLFINNYQL